MITVIAMKPPAAPAATGMMILEPVVVVSVVLIVSLVMTIDEGLGIMVEDVDDTECFVDVDVIEVVVPVMK